MIDAPDSIVLEHLRHIRKVVDRTAEDIRDLKTRVTSLEANVATLNNRMDRIEERFEHIERRLDLSDV